MEHRIAEPEPRIRAERILVIQFRQIGDVLLSTPVLRALRSAYPQSYIAFLTEPSPGRVLQSNPLLDEVIIRPRHATWHQQWQLLRHIRHQRFELVIDLIGNPRSAVLTCLSGARHRLAFARFPRSLFYTMLVPHHHPVPEYTVAKRLRLLEPLGIRATDLTPILPYTQCEQDIVAAFLRGHAITPKELLVCIDPTHHVPTRQWPGGILAPWSICSGSASAHGYCCCGDQERKPRCKRLLLQHALTPYSSQNGICIRWQPSWRRPISL
jgi:ADP-heptose:LPS heptosyltransferase